MLLNKRLTNTFNVFANENATEKIAEFVRDFLGEELFLEKEQQIYPIINSIYQEYSDTSPEEIVELLEENEDTKLSVLGFFFNDLKTQKQDQLKQDSLQSKQDTISQLIILAEDFLGEDIANNYRQQVNSTIIDLINTYSEDYTEQELLDKLSKNSALREKVFGHFFEDILKNTTKLKTRQDFDLTDSLREFVLNKGIVTEDTYSRKADTINRIIDATARQLEKTNDLRELENFLTSDYQPDSHKLTRFIKHVFQGVNIKDIYTTQDLVRELEEVLHTVYGVDPDDYAQERERVEQVLTDLANELIARNDGNIDLAFGVITSLRQNANSPVGKALLKIFRDQFPSLLISKYSVPELEQQEDPKELLVDRVKEVLTSLTDNPDAYSLLEDYIEHLIISPVFKQLKSKFRRDREGLVAELASPSQELKESIEQELLKLIPKLGLPARSKDKITRDQSKWLDDLTKVFITMYPSLTDFEIEQYDLDSELGPKKIKTVREDYLKPIITEAFEQNAQQDLEFLMDPSTLKSHFLDYLGNEGVSRGFFESDSFTQTQSQILDGAVISDLNREPQEISRANKVAQEAEQKARTLKANPDKYKEYKEKAREVAMKLIPRQEYLPDKIKQFLTNTLKFSGYTTELGNLDISLDKPIGSIPEARLEKYIAANYDATRRVDPENPFQIIKYWEDLTPEEKSKQIAAFKRTKKTIPIIEPTGNREFDDVLFNKVGDVEIAKILNKAEKSYTSAVSRNINYFADREIKKDSRQLAEEIAEKTPANYNYYIFKGHITLPWDVLEVPKQDREQKIYTDKELIQLTGLSKDKLGELLAKKIEEQVKSYNDRLHSKWTEDLQQMEKEYQNNEDTVQRLKEELHITEDKTQARKLRAIIEDLLKKQKTMKEAIPVRREKIEKILRDYPAYDDRLGIPVTTEGTGLFSDVSEQDKKQFNLSSLEELGLTEKDLNTQIVNKMKETGQPIDLSKLYKRRGRGRLSDEAKKNLNRATFKGQAELDLETIVWTPEEGWIGSGNGLERSFTVADYSLGRDLGTNEYRYRPFKEEGFDGNPVEE